MNSLTTPTIPLSLCWFAKSSNLHFRLAHPVPSSSNLSMINLCPICSSSPVPTPFLSSNLPISDFSIYKCVSFEAIHAMMQHYRAKFESTTEFSKITALKRRKSWYCLAYSCLHFIHVLKFINALKTSISFHIEKHEHLSACSTAISFWKESYQIV